MILDEYKLNSNWIPIECKNYSYQIENPEYSQLVDRCSKIRQFAMIVCRNNKDKIKDLEQCSTRWNDHGYLIIVLNDEDLHQLLIFTDMNDKEKINAYIKHKIQQVTDRNY